MESADVDSEVGSIKSKCQRDNNHLSSVTVDAFFQHLKLFFFPSFFLGFFLFCFFSSLFVVSDAIEVVASALLFELLCLRRITVIFAGLLTQLGLSRTEVESVCRVKSLSLT